MAVFHKMSTHLEDELSQLRHTRASTHTSRFSLPDLAGTLVLILGVLGQLYVLYQNFLDTLWFLHNILAAAVMFLLAAGLNVLTTVLLFFVEAVSNGSNASFDHIFNIWGENDVMLYLGNIPPELWNLAKLCWPLLLAGLSWVLLAFLPRGSSRHSGPYIPQSRIEELQAGIDGENRMAQLLRTLPDNYDVFQNLYVTLDGHTSETDFVVIGPTGVFVVETKNYGGAVQGDASAHDLVHIKKSGTETIYNPVHQVATHVHRVSNRLRRAGYNNWTQGIVGFVGSAQVSVSNTTATPIFSGDDLSGLCRYITTYQSDRPISSAAQRRMVDLLAQESQTYAASHPGA